MRGVWCIIVAARLAGAQPPYNAKVLIDGVYLPAAETGAPDYSNGCCWLMSAAVSVNASSANFGGSFIVRPDPASIPAVPITPAPAGARNVLYILVDDLRPDVAPFSASFMHTPNLQALATSPGATVFTRAYCNIAVCSPSRMSFLTGRYPHHTLTWNFQSHVRQAVCAEHRDVSFGTIASIYRVVAIGSGGAAQCCTWCTNDTATACVAWTLLPDGATCHLFTALAPAPRSVLSGSISGLAGSTSSQRSTITLPQHFTRSGYWTLASGKIFHTEEGGAGPAPWDGEGTGMPPLQDPPSWSQAPSPSSGGGVTPGNSTMWNVNALAPMRPCAGGCSVADATLAGDVPSGTFRLCDRIVADDALLKLEAAAAHFRASGQPFFLAAGFRKPHLPFRHPAPYDALYPNASAIPLARYGTLDASVPPVAFHQTGLAANPYVAMDPGAAGVLRRDYYAAISWTDYNVGRLLRALEDQGLANETLVVFHADHGWSLGEHGEWEKFTNWEHGTRVPLVVRAPWLAGGPTNVSALVQLIDVFPSIAQLAGVPVDPQYQMDGTSFASLLQQQHQAGEATAVERAQPHIDVAAVAAARAYALSVYPRCPADLANASNYWADNDCMTTERSAFAFMGLSLRVDGWRYTEWCAWNGSALAPLLDAAAPAGGVELYSHAGDDGASFDGPFEVVNLAGAPAHAAVQAQLAALLRTVYPAGPAWQGHEIFSSESSSYPSILHARMNFRKGSDNSSK